MRQWSERMSPNFAIGGRPNLPVNSLNPHTKAAPISQGPPIASPQGDATIHYSFNVPFASDLAGPNTEDILHATTDAVLRWTHPEDAPDEVPVHELPIHSQNLANLQRLCRDLSAGPLPVEAQVITTTPKNAKGQVTTRCTHIDIDGKLVCDLVAGVLKKPVIEGLDTISAYCGVDIFLLGPKLTPMVDGMTGDAETRVDQRWRIAIYGDVLAAEHAKARVLIQIDRLLGRVVDAMYRYCPPSARRRDPNEIFITGESQQAIDMAKQRLHDAALRVRVFVKDVQIAPAKIDSILLTRLDKRNMVRVQGLDVLHVERAIREIMALAGQFYSASWLIQHPDPRQQLPTPAEIRAILGDVCANSDAEISFDKHSFNLTGSDDAVKAALSVMSEIKFIVQSQYQIRVKIELASEHKEFVSGKKNGKINKIMGSSNVQIIFDGFNEYNFNIDVMAVNYEFMKRGLSMVEQEMPASISFHVPDQYHKRIIGIGGQHIQRIMKKHSVFVKFSNAMDRGGMSREDDDIKVDNVICRTPARNAQNLDAVKNEILEMVDRADSEYTSQTVNVDRLYHRQLLARLGDISDLESKYNCKIHFPSTEDASDEVKVDGPQWQVPHCVDELLGMVPDNHEMVLARSTDLVKFLESPDFAHELVPKFKTQHEVEVTVHQNPDERSEDGQPTITLMWSFTRNNAGGLRDAIDFLQSQLATAGVEISVVKGSILRPKSDSFEDSLQYFNSRLLQHAPAPIKTDSLKNSSTSAANFFKGSTNVSKSSLISIESARSFNADRNPWNDSGVNLPEEDHNIWGPPADWHKRQL
ncbi:unnamed protein product [Parascedosporium putredinis]|uniref:K Homology domain-containing protein n=1 Tax=Parascedosporium putredinis TaxID=1442378 RepID=A0A9P1GV20_9PEZI|nr:unnamed protein product [Parascedosporium putredinis]CAI7987616.1 unnamed protein product [Parascedosporium putredinis]